ncbi:MAG: helix-hairpin-helix domain-containing protein [Enterococcus lacertideformus]|uniref:Helix-hairpin-helix domain-containing protein n=1 Tax=Enterococcus lacertideformus TaxID=2771493 RepID=A0A931B017_9ENTE|nr:helix-hairpin-helix domain-containing protein [Enterococcus lacertideformus]
MKKIYYKICASPKLILCGVLFIFGIATLFGWVRQVAYQNKGKPLLTEHSNDELLTEVTQEKQHPEELVEETSKTANQMIYVDVKGAVNKPGMYTFSIEARVYDVIQKSGGLTAMADEKQINLAAKITDQQLIYVPEIGEELTETQTKGGQLGDTGISMPTDNDEKINLNTADLIGLQQIPGIGEKKAQEIIQYRQENGSFKSIDELQEISGIGQKTVEKIKNFVTITGE